MEARNTDKPNEAPNFVSLERRLTAISDITLGVMISAFFQCCDPPQRKFPIDKGEKPAWWPETEPYKEPYNLKKKSKANVLTAIIENLIPNFSKMEKAVRRSKSLEKAMSSLESYIWSAIMTDLKNGHIKFDVVVATVQDSAGPSEPPAEKESRTISHTVTLPSERNLGLKQSSENNPPRQGLIGGDFVGNITNNHETRPITFVGSATNKVAINPNEGVSNVANLSKVNQLSEHPSLGNQRMEYQIDFSNDVSGQYNLLEHETFDQEFWRFMNNYQK